MNKKLLSKRDICTKFIIPPEWYEYKIESVTKAGIDVIAVF